ncbi:MAG TPA: DNA-3-methyladenine glycosylase [Opitutaceae bacterium]|nr:DNA-3-methyladenine glycosylase [Opitutaceae bacterium]
MGRVLSPRRWRDGHTAALARSLLGQRLVRLHPDGRREARAITEVEAYHGEEDLACHASRGRTARTEVLYGASGAWYVYLCYGIHEMLNLVVGPPGHPAAILIRGVEGISGPGRLTRALEIGRALNGRPAARASGLWIEEGPAVPRAQIEASPRVGIDYAGPIWSAKPWRFTWRRPADGSPPGSRARSRS